MHKGFSLNWVVSNDGRMTYLGAQDLQALRDLGAQVARFEMRLGAASGWNDALIERFRGVARQLAGAGITPICLFSHEIVPGAQQSQWNANSREVDSPTGGDNAYIGTYVETARTLASRMPEARIFEIWNEPNVWKSNANGRLSGGSFIYPSLYATLLARTYVAVKQVRQDATVISGGLFQHNIHGVLSSENCGATYLEQVLSALAPHAGRPPVDGIGLHPYVDQPGHADHDHIGRYLQEISELGRRHGVDGPLFITESGWSTSSVAPDLQASNLRTLFAACHDHGGVEALCWFQVRDNPASNLNFGVCTADWKPKPAYQAFQQAEQ
jgi:hypothetical protein